MAGLYTFLTSLFITGHHRTQRELGSRRDRISQIEGKTFKYRQEINANLYQPPIQQADPENNVKEVGQMERQEIEKMNKSLLDNQDHQLDQIIGYAHNIKRQNEEIHEEVLDQNKALDNLNSKVERTSNHMAKTQGKMDKLLQRTSNTCLYAVLCGEILLLILLVLL